MKKRIDKIKLFVSDMDGTLLNSKSQLSKETIPSIERLQKNGVKFTIATGRMMSAALEPVKDFLKIDTPLITLNGCFVGFPEIFHDSLSDSVLDSVYDSLVNVEAAVILMMKDSAYMCGKGHIDPNALNHWVANIEYIDEILPEHNRGITEILVSAGKETMLNFHEEVSSIVNDHADVFTFPSLKYAPMWYCEVRKKNVNKGESLRALRNHLGLAKEEVFVVGDYLNDIELFEEAGFSACPSNAVQEILDIADFVSEKSCDENAVGDIINKLFT